MGSGILPISIVNNNLCFLFGQESIFDDTQGYSDFGGSSAGGQTNLNFSQGDYLMFSFDCDSGNANLNVQFTVEFYIDDTL